MMVAVGLGVLGRWAHSKTIDGKTVVYAVFATLVIAFMDQGATADIASGFAWLFLVAILLGTNSPITGLVAATK